MIHKKKLIELFEGWKAKLGDDPSEDFIRVLLKAVIDKIKAFPEENVTDICVGNKWIPASERLPEDGEDVLVWFEYFRYGSYNRLFQTYGLSYTYNGKWSGFVNGQSGWMKLKILAWQPLPEPYKD